MSPHRLASFLTLFMLVIEILDPTSSFIRTAIPKATCIDSCVSVLNIFEGLTPFNFTQKSKKNSQSKSDSKNHERGTGHHQVESAPVHAAQPLEFIYLDFAFVIEESYPEQVKKLVDQYRTSILKPPKLAEMPC